MKKVLITGITGFVGSHLADLLSEKDDVELYGLKRYHLSREDNISHLVNKVTFFDCDLLDSKEIISVIKKIKPDIIFHMASQSFVSPSWGHPILYMSANYNMTVNLFEACLINNINPLIHIPGSGEEYGEIDDSELPIHEDTILRPVNPYAVTKIAQDFIAYVYFRSYGLNVIRTRAFNHEGPRRDKVFGLPMYAYQLAKIEAGLQEPVISTGVLTDRRNLTHVKDMVQAYWLAVNKCEPGELYIIGNNEEKLTHTYEYLLELLISKSTVDNIEHRIDDTLIRPVQVPRLICDPSKFYNLTKWKPLYDIDQIVGETLDYWRNYVNNRKDNYKNN
jgi:GDP-4-dehydro-6-deoxy-D-mannose reductase